jgi:sugar O-acyltransferase (sialic acid O-acetyltransferase NeuD family)
MRRALIGAGGSSHDIRALTGDYGMPCFVDDKYWPEDQHEVFRLTQDNIFRFGLFNPGSFEIVVAVNEPHARENIVRRLPKGTSFWSYVHDSAQLLHPSTFAMGEGSVISANCVIVCHSHIGKHSYLNIGTVIGHDSVAGDYFTTAPGAMIMGDCRIGDRVYFGARSTCKQKVKICDDVTIGMGAVVVKDITKPGTYIGCPAKRVK